MKESIRFAVGDEVIITNKEKKAFGRGNLVVEQVVRLKSGEIRYVVCKKTEVSVWRHATWRVGVGDIEIL